MADDGFHEIQLNGKQLIFLCMTAALILVVAFLSGVLVGRGVRAQKEPSLAAETMASAAPSVTAADQTSPGAAPAPDVAPPVPAIAPPTPAEEDLSYDKRLEGKDPPKETIEPAPSAAASAAPVKPLESTSKSAPSKPPPKAAPIQEPPKPVAAALPVAPPAKEAAPKVTPDATRTKADATSPGEPPGPGYYLKLAALRDRAQADALAKRLSGKGYSSYVVPMSGRSPVLYSVRVGKYKTRREADAARRRLEKEEQYKPLISR